MRLERVEGAGVIIINFQGVNNMDKKIFKIPNISCSHCVNSIKNELEELEGISKVEGDPGTKEITVEWEAPASIESIKDILVEINYPPAD